MLAGAFVCLTACGDSGVGATESGTGTGTGATTQMGSTSTPGTTTEVTPTTTTAEPVCGDGQIDPGETCDDGPDNGPGKPCDATCQTGAGVCGDGVVGPGEECDDGVDNGDMSSCTAACANNVCGDGKVGPGEGCDDGNQVDGDACTNACALASCGDGVVGADEACDDGNKDDTDMCTSSCTAAACSDGFVQAGAGEECDAGVDNADEALCTTECKTNVCGDGHTYNTGDGAEECDNGVDNGPGKSCSATCTLNVCGDGDQGPAEECDDGNVAPADGCSATCTLEACGNEIVEVACWADARRKFHDLYVDKGSELAREALERIGALYDIEAGIRGHSPAERKAARQARAGPVLEELQCWLDASLRRVPGRSGLAAAIRYARSRWGQLCRYRDDGRLEIDNSAAERALRGVALGRKNWLLAGSMGLLASLALLAAGLRRRLTARK